MKTFYEYITELAAPRKPLWIFDFDDTLAVDSSKVDVVDKATGKVIKSLTSAEFREYKLKDGEEFDFSSTSKKDVQGRPIPATLKILRSIVRRGGRAVILTGRNYGDTAQKYLKQMGIDIEVVAIGTKSGGSHRGVAKAKADWIQAQIDQGYNDIEFFDDNKMNLEYAKSLAKPGEIRVRTRHIKYNPRGSTEAKGSYAPRYKPGGSTEAKGSDAPRYKPGEVWQTKESRLFGGKNSDGEVRYFSRKDLAQKFASNR